MERDNNFEIDAVITWVDGSDPIHIFKKNAALSHSSNQSGSTIAAGKDATRFKDNGELRYCLASISKFAPWIRRVHLITDNQRPDFLTPELSRRYRVNIVDHRDVFSTYEWALPTFNSRSIESLMWRIPDLSEHFIYFNDDFVLTRNQLPDNFFLEGKVILRGSWKPLRHYSTFEVGFNRSINLLAKRIFGVTRTMHLLAQMRGAHLAGYSDAYYRSPHVPHPIRKSTLGVFYNNYPDRLEDNLQYKFRDMTQHLAVSLANHLEIQSKNAILVSHKNASIISGEYRSRTKMLDTLSNASSGELDFLCLGSVEKLDDLERQRLDEVLRELLYM